MIHTRFNLITKASNTDADRLIGYALIPAVPRPGELINIDSEPYYVREVSYALKTDPDHLRPTDDSEPQPSVLYCYVRLLRPFDPYGGR
jgi:hypothetical protein